MSKSIALIFFIISFILLIPFAYSQNEYYALNPPSHYNAPGNPGSINLTESIADDLSNLGVRVVRIEVLRKIYNDSPDIDYNIYDTIYSRMSSRGIKVMWLIDYQTVGQYSGNWNDSLDSTTTNAYIRDFRDKLAELATHYQGKVKYWQIWNEQNLCFSGYCPYLSTTTFAALLQASYETLKSIDSSNLLISGGLATPDSSGVAARDYLRSVYSTSIFSTFRARNGTYPIDRIAHHPYVTPASQVTNNLLTVYSAVTLYNDIGRKMWVTEFGWPTEGAYSVTESVQSTYLIQSYQNCENLTVGTTKIIENMFWFKYSDEPSAGLYFGLRRSDNTQKPSYFAYQSLATTITISTTTTNQINVILNKPVWYTCCTSLPGYPGNLAFDGIIDTSPSTLKWATGDMHNYYNSMTVQHWLVVDLGQTYTVNSIICYHAPSEPHYVQTELAELQYGSTINGPWTTMGTVDQRPYGFGNYDTYSNTPINPPQSLRYFRFLTTFVNGAHPPNVGYTDTYVRLNEIEVWSDDPNFSSLYNWFLY